MVVLVDTERTPQQALDHAASCILTDRSLPYPRASWQQCTCCDEWIEESNIEYTYTCTVGSSPSGPPTPFFQLKTRWPAYTCPRCVGARHKHAGTPAGDSSDDEGEAEQLCPLHVQAVYTLQGSGTADNMGAIAKGFHVHCPDCQFVSRLLKTPVDVRNFVTQHLQFSSECIKLKQALTAGTYDSPAAFGASNNCSKVQPEKVILELMSRLVVMTACHIVGATRPPPTPLGQLSGEARRTAAATAHIRSSSKGESSAEGQQLLPYRAWAVDALSLDSELLTEANWVRPSLAGLALEHKPSLLDLVLAPPYIAVAEHDAGMTVDKLAVLLLREQQQHKSSSLHRLAAVAGAGGDQLPAAVAAVEAAVSDLLAADAVFQHVPVQQRVQQFLNLSGIPSLGDIVCALAQPHVAGRGPHHRHLAVCAVCGMTPAALQRAKRSYALHRCKYCIVTTCQSCKQEQEEEQGGSPIEAAAAEQLCLWCQGHPDTQDLDEETTSSGSGSSRDKQRRQQHDYSLSSPEGSVDQADGDTIVHHRSSRDYDLVVGMAAVAAGGGEEDQDSQLAVAANSKLQQEMEDLQRMQAELQSAAERLGIQGLQLAQPSAAAAAKQTQNSIGSKHRLPPDAALASGKRQRLEEQKHNKHNASAAAAASGTSGRHLPAQKQQQQQPKIRSPSPSGAADAKRARAPPVPRCGQCKTCTNLQLRKGCAVNRKRYAEGKAFIMPPGADQIPRSVARQHSLAAARAAAGGRGGSAAVDNALAGLLLSSAGFRPVSSAAAAAGAAAGHRSAQAGAPVVADMLVDAGFAPAAAAPAVGDQRPGEVSMKAEDQNDQQQCDEKAAAAAALKPDPTALLKSLDDQIDILCADIDDWCSSNLAADHADVDKTLQIIQQLKQQLWQNYEDTEQQLFINGLEILGDIVGAFIALPDAGCKVVLACNSQRRVPAACCPDNQPCSVLELIMCCWFKEVQDSGDSEVGTAASDRAAAGGSPRFDQGEQQQIIRPGQCRIVLRLIAQLSALQYQVYYGPLAAGADLQQVQGQKEVVAALRDAVIHVISGTALLMLHEPEAESASSSSNTWAEVAAKWQQCLLQCKWAVANRCFTKNGASSAAVSVLKELGQLVARLLAVKEETAA